MSDLIKHEPPQTQLPAHFHSYEDWQAQLLAWVNTLKAHPAQAEIKINKLANDAKFLPIGAVQEKLDYFFAGLWSTKNFRWQVVANEIVGAVDLEVFHPKHLVWLTRSGAGAVQIQLKAEYETDENGQRLKDSNGKWIRKETDVMDVGRKIINTLGKDFPHLKAECEKNAAKELGNVFGRNLNRDTIDTISEITPHDEAEIRIKSFEDRQELVNYYQTLPIQMRQDRRILQIFRQQEKYIKDNPKPQEDAGN